MKTFARLCGPAVSCCRAPHPAGAPGPKPFYSLRLLTFLAEALHVGEVLGEAILPLLLQVLLVALQQPGSPSPWGPCLSGQAGPRQVHDDGGQGFDVVLGQSQSLDLGQLLVHLHVWDGFAQRLEGVVEFVHALAFSLVALQPPDAALLGAGPIHPAPPPTSPTCSSSSLSAPAVPAPQGAPPGAADPDRGLRALLLAGALLCVRFVLRLRVGPGPPGGSHCLLFGLHRAASSHLTVSNQVSQLIKVLDAQTGTLRHKRKSESDMLFMQD